MDELPTPEELRAKAVALRRKAAASSTDPEDRKMYRVVAREYDKLAAVVAKETAQRRKSA